MVAIIAVELKLANIAIVELMASITVAIVELRVATITVVGQMVAIAVVELKAIVAAIIVKQMLRATSLAIIAVAIKKQSNVVVTMNHSAIDVIIKWLAAIVEQKVVATTISGFIVVTAVIKEKPITIRLFGVVAVIAIEQKPILIAIKQAIIAAIIEQFVDVEMHQMITKLIGLNLIRTIVAIVECLKPVQKLTLTIIKFANFKRKPRLVQSPTKFNMVPAIAAFAESTTIDSVKLPIAIVLEQSAIALLEMKLLKSRFELVGGLLDLLKIQRPTIVELQKLKPRLDFGLQFLVS
jgi:hypothetical protein